MSQMIETIKDEALRESLYKNYENVQEMIKFAENKNTAIIASSGAILCLIFSSLRFDNLFAGLFSCGYFFVALAFGISFWALYPLYPLYSVKRMVKLIDNAETEGMRLNLFLFSHISQFPDWETFYETINKKYYSQTPLTNLEKDLVRSIYTNANIALRKFWLFRYSLGAFLMGTSLIIIFGPLKTMFS